MIGLCKAAKLEGEDGIIDQGYSLNAGRYVGVVIEDDGMTEAEFKETMLGLNAEYESLNEEAKKLETQISLNLRGLFKNVVEHIDEYNLNIIESNRGVGGFNLIDASTESTRVQTLT